MVFSDVCLHGQLLLFGGGVNLVEAVGELGCSRIAVGAVGELDCSRMAVGTVGELGCSRIAVGAVGELGCSRSGKSEQLESSAAVG